MDITEIISLLDELRGKATQGEWEYSEYGAETNDDVLIMQKTRTGKRKEDWIVIPSVNDGDASCITENKNIGYIVALHNALPALRQAALDGERYRKAAEAGRIVEEMVRSINQRREETKEIFAQDPDFARGYIQAYAEMGRNFDYAYRQAVEQKEV